MIMKDFEKLPEVQELIKVFKKRGYVLGYVEEFGLRMDKMLTEIRLIPEKDRLRLSINDDGIEGEETKAAREIGKEVVLKYGYRQGTDIVRNDHSMLECNFECYKYF